MKITGKKAIEQHYNKLIKQIKEHNWWPESKERLIKMEEENKSKMLEMFEKQEYVKVYKKGQYWRFEDVDQKSRMI